MAGNEEGGVRTKKVILAMSVIAMMMLVLVPFSGTSSGYQFGIEGGTTIMGTDDTLAEDDENGIRIFTDGTVYGASMKVVDSDGNTSSGAVSPSSVTFGGETESKLTVTAPSTPGDYKLVVEFELTFDGDKVTRTYPIKVVDPIYLSVDINNTSASEVSNLTLQFVVDGKLMDATEDTKDITIAAEGTTTVTYKWITDNVSGGRHTYSVQLHEDSTPIANVSGLDQEYSFYIGQNDYGWVVWLLIILTIVLILVLIWVVRKPVKNFGKPKGRR